MILLPNESEHFCNNVRTFIITNYRVYRQHKGFFNDYSMTIFHKDIASIEKKYSSSVILILLAIIFFCGFLYLLTTPYNKENSFLPLFLSLIFGVVWYLTRKHKLIITSHGGTKLKYIVSGNDAEIIKSVEIISTMKQTQTAGTANIASTPMNKKCSACQHPVNMGDSFCENCGASL